MWKFFYFPKIRGSIICFNGPAHAIWMIDILITFRKYIKIFFWFSPDICILVNAIMRNMIMGIQQRQSVMTMKKKRRANSRSPRHIGVAARVKRMLRNIPTYDTIIRTILKLLLHCSYYICSEISADFSYFFFINSFLSRYRTW